MVAAAVIRAVALPLARPGRSAGPPWRSAGLLVVGAVALCWRARAGGFPSASSSPPSGPAIAAASVVLALGQGLSEALTLLAAVCLYDMASFLTGTGPRAVSVGVLVGW